MAISQTTTPKLISLDANVDTRQWNNKTIAVISWAILVFCLLGLFVAPRLVLEIARLLAIYMLLRYMVIVVFYLLGLVHIRRTDRRARASSLYRGLPPEEIARNISVHHVVLVPCYKEPVDVIQRNLRSVVIQEGAAQHITLVLAIEESDSEAGIHAGLLQDQFKGQFAHFLITRHPANLPGETPGKGSNETWAARQAKAELVDRLGYPLESLILTTCDSDSVFHPAYFAELTRSFITSSERFTLIWAAPMLFDNDIWYTEASIRLITFFANCFQLSELTNPLEQKFPISTYSLSYRLAVEVNYWDTAVVAEDWHMFLRCFIGTAGKTRVETIYLPTRGNPVYGSNVWHSWANFYNQQLRHAWGILDIGYLIQQWNRRPSVPLVKRLARFIKITHDHLIFSSAGLIVLVGTLLSLALDNNPVVTIPPGGPLVVPFTIINAVGAASAISIWIIERIRTSQGKRSWSLPVVAREVISWILFPLLSAGLTGIPAMQAHAKVLLGQGLVYGRTPKGLKSQAGQ